MKLIRKASMTAHATLLRTNAAKTEDLARLGPRAQVKFASSNRCARIRDAREPDYDRLMVARYDGLADWYDEEFQPAPLEGDAWQAAAAAHRRRLWRAPRPRLRDGRHTRGRSPSSAGPSRAWTSREDMLRRAREKGVNAVRADAADLPFEDASFDAALSIFTHSDFDDFPAAMREVARVLKPGAPVRLHRRPPLLRRPALVLRSGSRRPAAPSGLVPARGSLHGCARHFTGGPSREVRRDAHPARAFPPVLPRRRLPVRAHRGAGGARLPAYMLALRLRR